MEYSKYNIKTTFGKKQVIYNTITNSFVIEGGECYNVLERFRTGVVVDSSEYRELTKNRFIVSSNIEETNYALELREKTLLSTDVFRLMVNVTFECNFSCEYCTQKHSKNTRITKEAIERCILRTKQKHDETKFKTLDFYLFGGEPLCNIDGLESLVNEFTKQSKELGYKIKYHITTNGSIANRRIIQLFKEQNVTFQITIDCDKTNHDKNRHFTNGRPSYEIIKKNIKTILQELPLCKLAFRSNYGPDISPEKYYDIIAFLKQFDRKRVSVCLTKIFQVNPKEVSWDKVIATVSLFNRFGFAVHDMSINPWSPCTFMYQHSMFIDWDGVEKVCPDNPLAKGSFKFKETENYKRLISRIPQECKDCELITKCLTPCLVQALDKKVECSRMISLKESISIMIKQEIIWHQFNS